MKKVLTVELEREWVFERRSDDPLPVAALENELKESASFKVENSSFTTLTLSVKEEGADEAQLRDAVLKIFSKLYPDSDGDSILTIRIEEQDLSEEKEEQPEEEEQPEGEHEGAPEEEQPEKAAEERAKQEQKPEQTREEKVAAVLEEIGSLVGAAEFKALAAEIAKLAPAVVERKMFDVIFQQSYLFSVGEGYGLTTCLNLLAKLFSAAGLAKMHYRPVTEVRLDAYESSKEPFADAMRVLNNGDKGQVRVLCVDISEWMEKTGDRNFKQFLKAAEKHSDEFILVFRVPFVDKDVLAGLQYSLNDLLSVRTVSFPPFGEEEIEACANKELSRYGFSVSADAWNYFHERISEEKCDGKFYGLNTIRKVVRELVYHKQLNEIERGEFSTVILPNDTRALCADPFSAPLSAMEQLDRLVGSEKIKEKLQEILAQIELSLKANAADRPCIHMRFLGNPGTGKTTVARIIGKILKEKGILRVGGFFEYSGRDFCGRYVGETAPKTASICRDAYGSVLFIDEAYSLYRGKGNDWDYGKEAIDTLIAEMENHRNDFVVIMAGYTDDMEKLMEGNLGLASRMPYAIEFPNFTREQLNEIFVSMAKAKFACEEGLFDASRAYFEGLGDEVLAAKDFSNARFVRNLFERCWAKAAMRCQLNKEEKIVLTRDDFERAAAEKEFTFNSVKKTRMGF